ncbi:MAG: redox-sensing transcriptional repressor Rex, partial [Gemmatimonadetes bacterium]
PGFRQRGFHVTAIYDKDPKKIGTGWNGLVVRDIRHLEADLNREPSDIAIVVTPATAAQDVVDRLVRAGVKAILNFAPLQLTVPPDVVVKSVNMALELETLSFALANR